MSDYIPEDVLSLILRCLPVKTLLQFRCVCKGWKKFIDSPSFIQEHLSLQNPNFLFQNEGSPECYALYHALPSVNLLNGPNEDYDDLLDEDDNILYHDLLFLGTNNGVVCLFDSSSGRNMSGASRRHNLVLWNPSIRKLLTIQIPDSRDCGWRYFEAESCFGFWIDPVTKEFKFVTVDTVLDEEDEEGWDDPVGMKGIVYSSIRQNWREIPDVELGYWLPHPPVMIQGVAHCRGNRSSDNAHAILSFDFVHERFELIEMSALCYGYDEPRHLHWHGNLSIVVKGHRYSACNNYILYMRQEGLWVPMFDFTLSPSLKYAFWVLGEEERANVLAGHDRSEMVFYGTRDGIISFPDEDSDEDDLGDRVRVYDEAYVAFDFVESLLFP